MTLHFAPACPPARARSRFARLGVAAGAARKFGNEAVCAANDNTASAPRGDELDAALRHFAAHGLRAAEEAANAAIAAYRGGDVAEFVRWLGICRALDRRRAARIERLVDAAPRAR